MFPALPWLPGSLQLSFHMLKSQHRSNGNNSTKKYNRKFKTHWMSSIIGYCREQNQCSWGKQSLPNVNNRENGQKEKIRKNWTSGSCRTGTISYNCMWIYNYFSMNFNDKNACPLHSIKNNSEIYDVCTESPCFLILLILLLKCKHY